MDNAPLPESRSSKPKKLLEKVFSKTSVCQASFNTSVVAVFDLLHESGHSAVTIQS